MIEFIIFLVIFFSIQNAFDFKKNYRNDHIWSLYVKHPINVTLASLSELLFLSLTLW